VQPIKIVEEQIEQLVINTTPVIPAHVISPEAVNKLAECDKRQGQRYINWCYRDIARAEKDHTICERIQYQVDRDSCYSVLAGVLKDQSLCEKVSDEVQKDNCIRGSGMKINSS
jgi:hypothetical protein